MANLESGAIDSINLLQGTQSIGAVKIEDGNSGLRADVFTSNGYNVLGATAPAHVSTDNSTSTPLDADATFTGEWEDITNFGVIQVVVNSSHGSATDGLKIEFSTNASDVDSDDTFTIPANTGKPFSAQAQAQYFRIKYTNGSTLQTHFRLQTVLKPYYIKPSSHRIQDAIISDDDAELVKAVITGKRVDGVFANANLTNGNNLKISLEELESGISTNSNSQLKTTIYSETGIPLLIDPSTEAMPIVDYAHHEIHEGDHYFIKGWMDLTNAQVFDFLATTPDTLKWAHMVVAFSSEAESHITIYEGTTTSADGTAVTAVNRNRNSSNTPGVVVTHTPTVTGVGTQIASYKMGSMQKAGGEVRGNNELVLKQNTKYLIRITNDTALNNWFDYLADWYEHTDDN